MATLNIFSKNRIAIETLITDTVNFTVFQFKQSRTNFTVASAYGQIIFVLENLMQLILYYIEDSITELNINSATRSNSVYALASLAGHNPTRAIAAIGEITFKTLGVGSSQVPGGSVVLLNYMKINCVNNGLTYLLDLPADEMVYPLDGTLDGLGLQMIQGTVENQSFTSNGLSLQSVSVNMTQSASIDNFNVSVYVNGQQWQIYKSLYDIPYQANGCIVKTSIASGGVDVFFGNGAFGAVPQLGATILVEYIITNGQMGNLYLADITESQFSWTDTAFDMFGGEVDLTDILKINVVAPPSFGADPEPLALTRLVAPKTSRSYVLANPDSYIIYFEQFNFFSIVDAYQQIGGTLGGSSNDSNIIYLFLIPNVSAMLQTNQNYFNIPVTLFTLTAAQQQQILNLVSSSGQMIVTTELQIVAPVLTYYVINIALILYTGAGYPSQDAIIQQILNNLSQYFLNVRRRDRIPRSDVLAIIESISGIDSVNLTFVSQVDEAAAAANPKAVPVGIDGFGDIIIQSGQLPIIRGGWSDRNGLYYGTGVGGDTPGSVNVVINSTIVPSYNTSVNSQLVDGIITSNSTSSTNGTNQNQGGSNNSGNVNYPNPNQPTNF